MAHRVQKVVIHGHERAFVKVGTGPVLLLLHGLGCDHTSWDPVLGIETVTVVGHSLGGGVAMQFAYQFPERTERMVLVAPGGIGPDVTRAVRAVTLPMFQQIIGLATLPGIRHVGAAA